jgi:two-component system response regulator AtoC
LVDEAVNLREAAKKIEQGNFDVIILDLKLPDGISISLFDSFAEKLASRTIIITANATVPSVVEAIKKGAFNYLEKPVEEELLVAQVKKIVELNRKEDRYRSIESEAGVNYRFDDVIFESKSMADIVERAKVLARTNNTILIQGETGVGKEVISRSIHNYSLRNDEIFLPVNCASIPTELFESELFGFEKGAFTGAVSSYSGRFIQADRGTLFLDEIGELPLPIQAKLLRILDENVIYQLKSKKALKVDIRLIAATNKILGDEVNMKQFRSDLYYRLKESSLLIPPLRERVEDILPLIRHFIKIYNHIYDKNVSKIGKEAENYLLNYSWRGNVREVKNTVKSIIPFKKNNTIDLDDLSYSIIEGKDNGEKQLPTLENFEKQYIIKVLKTTGFNITRTAEVLGINRPRLYRKIKQYRLEDTVGET